MGQPKKECDERFSISGWGEVIDSELAENLIEITFSQKDKLDEL